MRAYGETKKKYMKGVRTYRKNGKYKFDVHLEKVKS